ncbi:MAG TPA: hypothetical protein VGO74_00655 [Modestobacter sp.]|jgi:hypothetical protein|nr:hypothetical protein [Modestobacter sp.]
MTPTVHPYGTDPAQFLELTLPAGGEPAPVVVVLHAGGGWPRTLECVAAACRRVRPEPGHG